MYKVGTNNNGMISDIASGTAFTIPAGVTKNHHLASCADRVIRGSIEASTNGNHLLASGWVSGRNDQNFRSGATVMVNNGMPF